MHFSWFHQIPALRPLPDHVLTAAFCTILIAIVSVVAGRAAGTPQQSLVPDKGFTIRGLFEVIVESLSGLIDSILGHGGDKYLGIVGGFFIYILFNNLLGLLPGFSPATDNINTTLSLGLLSFLIYNVEGFKANGVGYIKHFMGPIIYLAPFMFILELISHFVRPLSLGMRLYGNMMGDHSVLSVFLDLAPYGIPMIFYALGLFVCFIQAFVFCLLSLVYLQMATAHDH